VIPSVINVRGCPHSASDTPTWPVVRHSLPLTIQWWFETTLLLIFRACYELLAREVAITSMLTHKPYPSDGPDDEWTFLVPYLALMKADAPQRQHDLRELFNDLRGLVRAGAPWRMLPHDLPPWEAVYQQTQRWLSAGCLEAIVHDRREMLRQVQGRKAQPSAVVFDGRTLQATCKSGPRAGYKCKKGSKVHRAVDTLGHLLALLVTPANEPERAQVAELARSVQQVTGPHVDVAFVDQGYTGDEAAAAARQHGIRLDGVKLPETKRVCVLLLRPWVVERRFGWIARFRRLARDYERLAETLAGLRFVVFAILVLVKAASLLQSA